MHMKNYLSYSGVSARTNHLGHAVRDAAEANHEPLHAALLVQLRQRLCEYTAKA